MPEAYIVEAVRTPVGKKNGGLADAHPADLGAHVLTELVRRADIDPAVVEDVVFGCLDTIGPQAGDIARTAWLAAGLPEEVPGATVDRQCGSSQQAVHFAAQAVRSGTATSRCRSTAAPTSSPPSGASRARRWSGGRCAAMSAPSQRSTPAGST